MDISRRRSIGLTLAIALLAAIAAATWLALGPHDPAARAAAPMQHAAAKHPASTEHHAAIFTERCRFSHAAADDPILMPGQPGAAMHHDFFGNVTTGASTTASTLADQATTCGTSADASAYWSPKLYQDGRPLTPRAATLYWRRAPRGSAAIQTLPVGLEMIAGDETATQPQGIHRVAWSCAVPGAPTGAGAAGHTATPHDCPAGARIKLTVFFPSCWDGHDLSAVGQTNVVYPQRHHRDCPASHPVQIPQLVFHVRYPTSSAAGLTLSMSPTMRGSTDTAHADFVDGWKPEVLARDVDACLRTPRRCGPVRGPQATPQGPRHRRR